MVRKPETWGGVTPGFLFDCEVSMVVDKAVRKGFGVSVCTVARLHGVDWENDWDLSVSRMF